MALVNKIEEILKYIESKQEYLELSKEMFEVLEGDIHSKLKQALRVQLLSDASFNSAVQRIPPINIMKRISQKLTQIYSTNPKRTALIDGINMEPAQLVVDYYADIFNLNTKFNDVDFFGNSIRYSSSEPYVDASGLPKLRVIPSHNFLVWSDDNIEPSVPTVFIKSMGEIKKSERVVKIYWLYSDEEFLEIDSDGVILRQEENPYGVMPQSYFNDSSYMLMPFHEIDLLKMSLLIPLLYTDMNDATRYMAYSLIYTLDADSSDFERNPNVIIDLKSDDPNKNPSIGTLEPKVDIPNVIELIKTQMADWLETKGLRSGQGDVGVSNNASGISLMIQEIDTTQRLKERMIKFEQYEADFWSRMIKIHNAWVANGTVQGLPALPEDMQVKIEFELPKPVEEEKDRLDRAILAKREGLATVADALKIWKPKMDDEEIEEKVAELEAMFKILIPEETDDEQELREDKDQSAE